MCHGVICGVWESDFKQILRTNIRTEFQFPKEKDMEEDTKEKNNAEV